MEEASFTFTTPLTVNIVEIKGEEHLFVEGDISTNDIDLVNDSMTKACQESMQKQILERNMKLDIEHEAFKGETHEEKEINKTKIPAGKLTDSTVKHLGKNRYSTRVKGEINRHNPNYKEIKGNLTEGYLDAFSVAFLPIDISYEKKEGKSIRMLNDVKLLNVALTGNPCNTKAQLVEVFTKSMDAVEEYKRLKELDPSIEDNLVVKNGEKKENPLSYIWNKIMFGEVIDKKEIKLLKAAIDVADNKGTFATLVKELFEKVSSGVKLSYKEYYVFKELIEMDYESEAPMMATELRNKSHSTDLVGSKQLNITKKNKMTEDEKVDPVKEAANDADQGDDADENAGEDNEPNETEQKAMFKSVSAEMKALSEKYDIVQKDQVSLKEDLKAISESLAKITEALSQPIHKSPGIQLGDAEQKAKASESKSVDPLDLCN